MRCEAAPSADPSRPAIRLKTSRTRHPFDAGEARFEPDPRLPPAENGQAAPWRALKSPRHRNAVPSRAFSERGNSHSTRSTVYSTEKVIVGDCTTTSRETAFTPNSILLFSCWEETEETLIFTKRIENTNLSTQPPTAWNTCPSGPLTNDLFPA